MSRLQPALDVDDVEAATLDHLGVEVSSVDEVDAEQTRLTALGLASVDERATTCRYAEQHKFWVEGTPGGERWEIYTVLADSPTFSAPVAGGTTCCGGDQSVQECAPTAAACC